MVYESTELRAAIAAELAPVSRLMEAFAEEHGLRFRRSAKGPAVQLGRRRGVVVSALSLSLSDVDNPEPPRAYELGLGSYTHVPVLFHRSGGYTTLSVWPASKLASDEFREALEAALTRL